MIEQDTVKLLRECDAGIKMGASSIDDVVGRVKSRRMKNSLEAIRGEHSRLEDECSRLLCSYGDEGKAPGAVAESMSWIKTNLKLAVDGSDAAIAELMTDGCNMGVKSLNRYLNQYKAADERSKDIAKRLISLEEKLAHDMQGYL